MLSTSLWGMRNQRMAGDEKSNRWGGARAARGWAGGQGWAAKGGREQATIRQKSRRRDATPKKASAFLARV